MSINPKSVHQIIQEVNERIDCSKGALNIKTVAIARKALSDLSEIKLTNSVDRMELISLASKITALSQEDPSSKELNRGISSLIYKPLHLFERLVGISAKYQNSRDVLSADFLAKTNLTLDQAKKIEDVLSKCPEERNAIVLAASFLVKENISAENVILILRAVQELPKEEREEICSAAGVILSKEKREDQIIQVLKRVADIPAGQRKEICLAGAALLSRCKNMGKISTVLDCLESIPPEDRKNGFQYARNLMTQWATEDGLSAVVSNIKRIPKQDRSLWFKVVSSVLGVNNIAPVNMKMDEIISVLNAVQEIPETDRKQFLNYLEHFMFEVNWRSSKKEKVDLLYVMKEIFETSKFDVFNYAKKLVSKDMEIDKAISILNAINEIPAKDRREVFAYSAPFINKETNIDKAIAILNAIKEIPQKERKSFFSCATHFANKYIEADEMTGVLGVMKSVPEKDREWVFSGVTRLINIGLKANEIQHYMKLADITLILNAIQGIPEEERESVFTSATHFIKPNMNSSEIVFILSVLQAISAKDRINLFTRVVDCFIKQGMDIHAAKFFLEAFKKIPEDNRSKIFTYIEKAKDYRNTPIANYLADILLTQGSSEEFLQAHSLLSSEKNKKENSDHSKSIAHKILPSIVPAKWIAESNDEASQEKSITELMCFLDLFKSEFRNNFSPLMQIYLLSTMTLDVVEGLTPSRKLQLLSCVCNSSDPIRGLGLVLSLCARKEIEALERVSLENPIEKLDAAFKKSLTEDPFIDLSGIENLADRYFETFGNTRVPIALEIYTAGIRSLGRGLVRGALECFVRSVLLDTFEAERYDTSKSLHLKQIQEYDEKNGSNILGQWQSLAFEAPVTSVVSASEEKTFSFEDFFRQKLGDGHGQKNKIEQFPLLFSFLKEEAVRRGEILGGIRERIKDQTEELSKAESKEAKKELGQSIKMDQVQRLCMELIANPDLSKEEQIEKVEKLNSQLSGLELGNDLKGLAKSLRAPQASISSEKVKLCKGWEDLFLAGSEVSGSCQRIDGSPSLNMCLLAYCLDGKNVMVAVKDVDGKLLARSMLRLLWDKRDSKPTLFLDRLYPSPCPKEREKAIKSAASECAQKLGLELYTDWISGSPAQGKTIESLGSSCPYEYADGAEGVMPNGVFTIRDARKIEIN